MIRYAECTTKNRLNYLIERLKITIVDLSFCTVPSAVYFLVVTG